MGRPFPAASLVDESRYDFFHNIHKALRLGHCRMIAALGTQDYSNDSETAETLASLRSILRLSRQHIDAENRTIYPELEARRPGLATRCIGERRDQEQAFAELESLVRSVEVATLSRRNRAGHALYRHYALFAATDIQHMNAEETDLLIQLHQAFGDEELMAIEARMMSAIDGDSMIAFMKLMLPALNHPERVDMLSRLQSGLPAEDFAGILDRAMAPVLDAKECASLMSAVSEAAGSSEAVPSRASRLRLWQGSGEAPRAPAV